MPVGFNLGLIMRQLTGLGTPRGLQGRVAAVIATLLILIDAVPHWFVMISKSSRFRAATRAPLTSTTTFIVHPSATVTYATGC